MDVTVESLASCSDAAKARAALEEALASARGPRRTRPREGDGPRWRVVVRFDRDGALARADAVIHDDASAEVARRTVTERGRPCVALAGAVGAWAALVLDQELGRARDEGPAASEGAPYRGAGFVIPTAPPADRATTVERPALEIGTSASLRSGLVGTGTAAAVTPHLAFEVAHAFLLRPSLSFGASTDRVPTGRGETFAFNAYGARLDACRRIPGNYIERRGIELDACGGADVVWIRTSDDRSGARVSLGPSAIVRGEIGAGFALEVRAAAGANLSRVSLAGEVQAPLLVAVGEVGVSTRWP